MWSNVKKKCINYKNNNSTLCVDLLFYFYDYNIYEIKEK